MKDEHAAVLEALGRHGYVVRDALDTGAGTEHWAEFIASYDRLEPDRHMADGGRYRLRRHASFAATRGNSTPLRLPHRPHRQALEYNPLNGGRDRWFAPVEAGAAAAFIEGMIRRCCPLAFSLRPEAVEWLVEAHQFRILGRPQEPGLPTPEGVHRDGVDFVLIMLVGRRNVVGGKTVVQDVRGKNVLEFCLDKPGQMLLLDDRRMRHGVSPIHPLAPGMPAMRDVLVITFAAGGKLE